MADKPSRFPISYRPKEDVYEFLEDFTHMGSMSKADLVDVAVRFLMLRSSAEIVGIIGTIKSGVYDASLIKATETEKLLKSKFKRQPAKR